MSPHQTVFSHKKRFQMHQASRFDIFLKQMQELPTFVWLLIYTGSLGLLMVAFNGLGWITGTLPAGQIDLYRSSIPVYPIGSIMLIDYLNRVAQDALLGFRPAMRVNDNQYGILAYKLVTMPRRGVWVTVILSLLAAAVYLSNTAYITDWIYRFPLIAIVECLFYGIAFCFMGIFFYHTGWQLWMVNQIHAQALHIDLFDRAPLYAFSKLSSRTGIALLLMNYFGMVTDPATFSNIALINVTLIAFVLAIASFLLPLQGIYRRIMVEKRYLQQKMNLQLSTVFREIHDADNQQVASKVEHNAQLLRGIQTTRKIINTIPAFPWERSTLIGFISAVILPFLARVTVGLIASWLI